MLLRCNNLFFSALATSSSIEGVEVLGFEPPNLTTYVRFNTQAIILFVAPPTSERAKFKHTFFQLKFLIECAIFIIYH